jgi:hypothetical protein
MKMIDKETMIIKSNAPLYSASPAWRTNDQAHIVPKSPNSFKKIAALSFTVRHAILPIRQRDSRLSSLDGDRPLQQLSCRSLPLSQQKPLIPRASRPWEFAQSVFKDIPKIIDYHTYTQRQQKSNQGVS